MGVQNTQHIGLSHNCGNKPSFFKAKLGSYYVNKIKRSDNENLKVTLKGKTKS